MDRSKMVLVLVALLVAAGTAMAARSLLAGSGTPRAETVAVVHNGPKVLVAQRQLPMGTIITADAVSYQDWPKELVKDAYFLSGQTDMNKLIGTVVRFPITAGQPLTQGALVAPGDRGFLAAALGPGMRAVTIPVSARTAVGGFVFPGDHVDLMLTQEIAGDDGGQKLATTETILRNVRVLATDQSTENEKVDGKTVVHAFQTVTLEVTPRTAEKVAVAQEVGQISLSLRSLADNQGQFEQLLASGDVKLPDNASRQQEDALVRQAMNRPLEDKASYVTGGDVSRFQRSTMPARQQSPQASYSAPGAPAPGPAYAAPAGPTVRVTRGKVTTAEVVNPR